jgi:act minimal PKS acyl carrier protein
MTTFTLDDLVDVMRVAAGENDDAGLDGDILDVPFSELGYDSLAVMETVSRIERDRGVKLPDELAAIATPREFLAAVNDNLPVA